MKFFVIYIIPYYLFEVIQHYNAKKGEKTKLCIIGAHPGIELVPLVPLSDTLTTRSDRAWLDFCFIYTIFTMGDPVLSPR